MSFVGSIVNTMYNGTLPLYRKLDRRLPHFIGSQLMSSNNLNRIFFLRTNSKLQFFLNEIQLQKNKTYTCLLGENL